MNSVEPQAYIADVIQKIAEGWPAAVSMNSCPGHGIRLRSNKPHRRCVLQTTLTVEQAHVGMHRRRHRRSRELGPAMSDGHRMFLVQAEHQAWIGVAEMVDEAVVETAETGAWIERDIGHAEAA